MVERHMRHQYVFHHLNLKYYSNSRYHPFLTFLIWVFWCPTQCAFLFSVFVKEYFWENLLVPPITMYPISSWTSNNPTNSYHEPFFPQFPFKRQTYFLPSSSLAVSDYCTMQNQCLLENFLSFHAPNKSVCWTHVLCFP